MINPYKSPAITCEIPSNDVPARIRLRVARTLGLGLAGYMIFVVIVRVVATEANYSLESGGGVVMASVFASSALVNASNLKTFGFLRRLIVSGSCMIAIIIMAGVVQIVFGFAPRRYEDALHLPTCIVLAVLQLGAMLFSRLILDAWFGRQ